MATSPPSGFVRRRPGSPSLRVGLPRCRLRTALALLQPRRSQAPHGQVATGPAPVEFVWSAPAQPELIHYLIEIRVLDSAGSLEVYSEFTDGSAVLAPLREIPGDYAWRVFSLARIAARYQASDWTYFTVVPPPAIAPPLTER